MNKKFFYEIDPLFFYDSNEDGYGDFKGFLEKKEYFSHLDVDYFIFPDIFNNEQIILKNSSNETFFDKYGKLKEMIEIKNWICDQNKDLFLEIDLANIINSKIYLVDEKDDLEKEEDNIFNFLIKNNLLKSSQKNNNKKNIDVLQQILSFYSKRNFNNFILKNVESLFNNDENLVINVIETLKTINEVVQNKFPNISISFKSDSLSNKDILLLLKENNKNNFIKFFFDNSLAFLDVIRENDIYLKSKKSFIQNLNKKISFIEEIKTYLNTYVWNFSSFKISRFSRLLPYQLYYELAYKSLVTFIHGLPINSVIFSGEELGLKNIYFKNYFNYLDNNYFEKQSYFKSLKLKNQPSFINLCQEFSSLSSQSVFLWNNKINCGFSAKTPLQFRQIFKNNMKFNLKNQFNNKESIFSYYLNLISFIKANICFYSFDQIKSLKLFPTTSFFSSYKIVIQTKDNKTLKIFINLTNEINQIKNKNNKIVFSNSLNNNEQENNKKGFLKPFEVFFYSNDKK